MGADNWAQCPRCLRREEKRLADNQEAIVRSYGNVTIETFDKMRADLESERQAFEDAKPTFREDYSFTGAAEGVVTVSYKGQCTRCGLKFEFEEEHQIPGLDNV